MAQIFAAPKEIKAPELKYTGKFDFAAYEKSCDEYIVKVQEYAKQNGSGDLTGEIVSIGMGDGAAQYVVLSLKPVKLIHLSVGDAWHSPYAKLLTAKYIREEIGRAKGLAKIFSKK